MATVIDPVAVAQDIFTQTVSAVVSGRKPWTIKQSEAQQIAQAALEAGQVFATQAAATANIAVDKIPPSV